MKNTLSRLLTLLALGAGALLMAPPARAATSTDGDIFLGVRAGSGTGSSKTYVVNLGQASQFENASSAIKLNLGGVGTDLTATFGSTWNSRASVYWGIAGTVGAFAPIGSDPANTVFGSRSIQTPWLRANASQMGAVTNSLRSLSSGFRASLAPGSATNSVIQNNTDINSWSSFQTGGVNAGPAPGYSFAFFNPSVEASFENGVAGAVLHFYRVKPATVVGEIDTNSDYLGRFLITSSGEVTFVPVAANGTNAVSIENATYSFSETSGTASVKVIRTGDFSVPASVTINAIGGTAASPTDYTFAGGVVNFAAGEAEKTQNITIVNRSGFQGNRTIVLALSSPSGATIGTNISTTVTINEDIEPSEIDLVDAQINVGAEISTATINLVRSGGTSPVTVDLVTADGTAVDGVNYTGGTQTISFAGNATTATATINLSTAANLALTQNKRFTVSLTNPGANASVGETGPAATVVRILATDSTPPTIAFTSPTPAANASLSAAAVTISGTASDNVEVDKVLVNFNGVVTTLTQTGTPVNWTRNYTAVAGLNTVVVTAVDARGHSSVALSRSFTFVKTGPLTVVSNNPALGTVTPAVTGANAYQVGKTYTFKATAKTGNVFLHWDVPGAGQDTDGPVLTVVYTEAILASPTITANFGPLPFDAAKIGDFNGLVSPHAGTASSNSTNGAMKLTLTKTGSFSGTLQIDGFKLTIPASQFTGDGNGRFGVNATSTLLVARGTAKPSLELGNVKWNSVANTITGTVKQYYRSAVIAQSDFTLDRAAFSAANKFATAPYLNFGGSYTVILQAKDQTNGLTTADYPQGDGVGNITITNAGLVTLSGKLADDTAITASAPLSTSLKAPLFVQLYSTKGSFTALVKLDSGAVDTDLTAIDSLWFRPWQNAVQWYPWGWEEGVKVDLLGALFDKAKTGGVIPGLPGAAATTANAELVFNGGLLDSEIDADVNISPTNVVKTLDSGSVPASSFKLTLATAKGDISGTFTHTDGTKPAYVGKVYQKGPHAGAYGYFMTAKPKTIDGLGQSGSVSLLPKAANN